MRFTAKTPTYVLRLGALIVFKKQSISLGVVKSSTVFSILITCQTVLKYCRKIFKLKELVLDIVFQDNQQKKYIRTLSEQLENIFANFIELVENNLVTAVLEKIMACIMAAAEGMKQSKTVNHYQPWFDDECVSFRSKTLNKSITIF